MSDSQQFELERYFDGLMDEQEQALFLSDSNNRQLLDQAKDLHDDIDDSLRRSFKFSPIGVDSIVTSLQKANVAEDDATSNLNETTKKNGITRTALIRFAIAATLLVSASVLFWMFSGDRTVTPFSSHDRWRRFIPRLWREVSNLTIAAKTSSGSQTHSDPARE